MCTLTANAALETWRALDTRLSPIIGPRGFAALYQRSLQRVQAEHAWLPAPQDGASQADAYAALHAALAQQPSERADPANAALLTAFRNLLASLIGQSLTAHILTSAQGGQANSPPERDPSP
ncbi:hypothetical protein [Aquabacterium sp.]|uniref:hypothetical protein n=1 Tax=Aquabacterium sp. TaxID=1872578 RepID=UPI002C3981D4|nr:hypothetical protein [Aquabacterium sp.]HSW06917.1 hypothetical protein [Aquabacterium sp.]